MGEDIHSSQAKDLITQIRQTSFINRPTTPELPTTQNMPSFTKTPGGSGASDKFQKQQAEKQGLGADNAAGHTEGHRPGEAPVASDSGSTSVGQQPQDNNPGTQGVKGE